MHIAIIPDGNRRWAKAQLLHPWNGHEKAIENFRELSEWCRNDARVEILTVWCFSTENWKRDEKEVSKLMQLLEDYILNERDQFVEKRIRCCHSGRRDRIPASLKQVIEETEEMTKSVADPLLILHLCVDYGGKDEVTRAVSRLSSTNDVCEESIRANLDHPELPDVDLVIRTSGEVRTSNFMLWQTAYAEWSFLPMHFPEFTPQDLAKEVNTISERKRRFGG